MRQILHFMKINLTICGIHELPEQGGKRWTHVISIWDKAFLDDLWCREQIKKIAPRAQLLFSFFEDTTNTSHPDGPLPRDVKRILDFTSQLPARAKVLVHCRAGVSRSTAIAYAIFCQHSPPGTEMENLIRVQSMRDLVMPNRLIVNFADKILKRKGGMLSHLRREPDLPVFLRPLQ
jgi:predicted protein tyrosine phosphatase